MPAQGKYAASASYLYVESTDAIVQHEINAAIALDLERRRRSFGNDADKAIAESKNDSRPLTAQQVALDINCNEAWATQATFSIECERYLNLGGAHPNVDYFAYNFSICAGKSPVPLTLEVICRRDVPCRETLTDLINQKLVTRGIDQKIGLDAEALKQFAITDGGLRFYANDDLPHAIAASGVIDVPFGQLKAVLRHDGPLAALLAP